MAATKLGDLKYEVTQVNASKFEVTLRELKHVPLLWVNLLASTSNLKIYFDLMILSHHINNMFLLNDGFAHDANIK
jgi:hypothetical protein